MTPEENVRLWIKNDAGLYNLARECIRRTATRGQAAQRMLEILAASGISKTPDGYRYTKTAIIYAMVGLT